MNLTFLIAHFRFRTKKINRRSSAIWLDRFSDNPKPVLSRGEGSKTCAEPFDTAQDKPYRRIENPKWLGLSVIAFAAVMAAGVVQAEQPNNIPRIGFLGALSAKGLDNRLEGFRLGLRALGYEEGSNIIIEYRFADGKLDRLPALATELVNSKVALVVTHGEAAIRALQQASRSIPIVVGVTGDLILTGHAASLARPGGNITGFVDTSPELSGKRLEIIRDIQPKISQIAVLWNAGNPVKTLDFKDRERGPGPRPKATLFESEKDKRFRCRI